MEILKIISSFYSIEYIKGLRDTDNNRLAGQIDYRIKKVSVERNIPRQKQLQTIIHEILHGISEELGIPMNEKFVRAVSRAMLCVILDNPWFFKEVLRNAKI